MKLKFNINKKILIAAAVFVLLFIVISVGYILLNPANNQSSGNPGGTGGDYSPPNSVDISNSGVLYNYLGSVAADSVVDSINNAVLYNISLSDDPSATTNYTQIESLSYSPPKFYKNNASYVVKIDNNQVNTIDMSPDYWFTFSTNDGRHFRADDKTNDSGDEFLYIKKTN